MDIVRLYICSHNRKGDHYCSPDYNIASIYSFDNDRGEWYHPDCHNYVAGVDSSVNFCLNSHSHTAWTDGDFARRDMDSTRSDTDSIWAHDNLTRSDNHDYVHHRTQWIGAYRHRSGHSHSATGSSFIEHIPDFTADSKSKQHRRYLCRTGNQEPITGLANRVDGFR